MEVDIESQQDFKTKVYCLRPVTLVGPGSRPNHGYDVFSKVQGILHIYIVDPQDNYKRGKTKISKLYHLVSHN